MEPWVWWAIFGVLAAILAFVATGYVASFVGSALDAISELNAIQKREERNQQRREKRKMIGYLVADHALDLAKTVAAMVNINPLTQQEEFNRIYEAVKAELLRYETRADRQHRRVNGCLSSGLS